MAKVKKELTQDEIKLIQGIGFRCAYYRKMAGLSQEVLAERAFMSPVTISHFESTSYYPLGLLSLIRISKALGIELWQLVKVD